MKPNTPEHARADEQTTRAWQRDEVFVPSLALLDLRVWKADDARPTFADLARRWRWTEERVRSFVDDSCRVMGWSWRPLDTSPTAQ